MIDDRWNAFITQVEPTGGGEGPLAGRTLGVKDLFDTAGVRTTVGSRLFADRIFTLLLAIQIVLLMAAFAFMPGVIGLLAPASRATERCRAWPRPQMSRRSTRVKGIRERIATP